MPFYLYIKTKIVSAAMISYRGVTVSLKDEIKTIKDKSFTHIRYKYWKMWSQDNRNKIKHK